MTVKTETGKERLREIIKHKIKKQKTAPIDWEKKKQIWLEQLELLYRQIENWLKDVVSIKIERQKIWITEEYIGRYQTDRLLIYVGDNLISFTPRGAIIIAAKGRVDISSSSNKRSIIILEKKGERPIIMVSIDSEPPPPKPEMEALEYEWLIVGERRTKDLTVLDEDTFTGLIADLIE